MNPLLQVNQRKHNLTQLWWKVIITNNNSGNQTDAISGCVGESAPTTIPESAVSSKPPQNIQTMNTRRPLATGDVLQRRQVQTVRHKCKKVSTVYASNGVVSVWRQLVIMAGKWAHTVHIWPAIPTHLPWQNQNKPHVHHTLYTYRRNTKPNMYY